MNSKKNHGGGPGYSSYGSNGSSSGGGGAGGGSNYSSAVQNAKQYANNGGSGGGGALSNSTSASSIAASRPNRGAGGGGGGHSSYNSNGSQQQSQHMPYYGSNGAGYAPSQQGYNDRKSGSYAPSSSTSSFHGAHYHGSNNGHQAPHYQPQPQQHLPTSQSFHANGGAGGHMSVHAKYSPHQSSYDVKANAGPSTAGNQQHHHHQQHRDKAQVHDPKTLAQPSETRILPSPSNPATSRTYSSDSSSSSSAAVAPTQKSEPAAEATLNRQPSAKTAEVPRVSTKLSAAVVAPEAVPPQPEAPVVTTNVSVAKAEDAAPTPAAVVSNPSKPTSELPSVEPSTPPPPKLADLVKSQQSYEDRGEYFRDLVVAIDRLYPDVKWPLKDTWTFWFIKHDSSQNWLDNVKEIADVSFVEDFWSVYRYLVSPSKLSNTTQGDLAFFKKGIKPTWEDAENKQGGSWLHTVSGQQQFNKKTYEVDDLWKETLLALIGDNFCGRDSYGLPLEESQQSANDHVGDSISGVFVAQRGKQYKLTLWTKNFRDEKTTRIIG